MRSQKTGATLAAGVVIAMALIFAIALREDWEEEISLRDYGTVLV